MNMAGASPRPAIDMMRRHADYTTNLSIPNPASLGKLCQQGR